MLLWHFQTQYCQKLSRNFPTWKLEKLVSPGRRHKNMFTYRLKWNWKSFQRIRWNEKNLSKVNNFSEFVFSIYVQSNIIGGRALLFFVKFMKVVIFLISWSQCQDLSLPKFWGHTLTLTLMKQMLNQLLKGDICLLADLRLKTWCKYALAAKLLIWYHHPVEKENKICINFSS